MSKGKRRLLVLALALTLVTSQLLPVSMFTLTAAAADAEGSEIELKDPEAKEATELKKEVADSEALVLAEKKEIPAENLKAEKITEESDTDGAKKEAETETGDNILAEVKAEPAEAEQAPAVRDLMYFKKYNTLPTADSVVYFDYDGQNHTLYPSFSSSGANNGVIDSQGRWIVHLKRMNDYYTQTYYVTMKFAGVTTQKNAGTYKVGAVIEASKVEDAYGNDVTSRVDANFGNNDYYTFGVVNYQGIIRPRNISVRLNNMTKVYGQKDPDKSQWATLTGGSLADGETLADILKLNRAKGEDVGEYPFTVGGSSSSGSGNSEAVKAPAAKSAATEEKAKVSDALVAAEKEKVDNSEQKPSTETKASRIGNYSVAFENNKGMLTITPAPVVITAVDNGKLYGTADPVLTYTVKGLLNGEKLPAGFVFNHRRAAGEAIGRYPINLEIDPKVADASNTSEKPEGPIDVVAPSHPWEDKEEVKEAVEAREAERADVEEREKVRVIVDKIPGEARPEQSGEVERPEWPNWPGIDPEPDPGQDPVITDDTNGFKAMNYEFRIVPGVFTITGTSAGTTTTPNNNGGGNNGGNGGNPAAGGDDFTVADAAVPAVAPAAQPTMIADPASPLSDGSGIGGAWALVNLICSILTVLGSLIAVIRRKKDEEEEEQNAYMNSAEDDEEDNRGKKMFAAKAAGILTAIASVITFILTEDMRLPMILIDKWTLLMVIMLAVQIVAAVLNKKASEADEEEDDAEATMA